MRVGQGYDIHSFSDDAGRALVLGGVVFEGETGLAGHSDADVLLHAICDALLGAHGLGDIGDHFPPDDPAWLNADSRELVKLVRKMLPDGIEIFNVDATIIAERPRVAPHREAMRHSVATLLELPAARVNVKATTNERLGALGRGEGIAALAIVLTGAGA